MNTNMNFMPIKEVLFYKCNYPLNSADKKIKTKALHYNKKEVIASNRWISNISFLPTYRVTGCHNYLKTSQISQIMQKTSLFFTYVSLFTRFSYIINFRCFRFFFLSFLFLFAICYYTLLSSCIRAGSRYSLTHNLAYD